MSISEPKKINLEAITASTKKNNFRYLTPENLYSQICHFTSGMSVTRDAFELTVDNCTLEDFEWNHMDQQHRPSVHNTYEKGIRIALGEDFAISLTQWKPWPLFITVTDVYVARGLFYQSLTLAGIIFMHSIISMEQIGDSVKLKDEWFIASTRLFKFLHKPISKKLHKLNARLQDEDAQIRHGRFALRKKGYHFKSDKPNYYNSNIMSQNTIYPEIGHDVFIMLDGCGSEMLKKSIGDIEFLVKKENDSYHVWPAACPHEGGPLDKGRVCDSQIVCPWHSLRFSPVILNNQTPRGARYGFEYIYSGDRIYVAKNMGAIQGDFSL